MDHSKKTTYLFSIDALRVIAILAVIIIHISTKTLATLNMNIESAPVSFFLNQTSRFAVPLFFLISGFVLELNYRKKLSYFLFFKKRASRIIIPFIFWSTIYFILLSYNGIYDIFSLKFAFSLIQGTAAYHLYFIPTLILFYISFPLLHKSIGFLKKPIVISVILAVQFLLLFYDYYIQKLLLPEDLRVALLSVSVFILGMIASHYKDWIYYFVKKHLLFLEVFFIILIASIYIHVSFLTLKNNSSSYIYNQYNPLNYIYTAVFALLFYYILEKTKVFKKIFIKLSKLSLFVFFIHVLIQYILWDNVVSKIIAIYGKSVLTNFWFDPLMFTIISSLSFFIAYLVHKVSWAPKITG